jgi:hypothetical protein
LRTLVVVLGLAFVFASLASACLDHYAEDWGCAQTGAVNAVGSGEGSAAVPAADCGVPAAEAEGGVGSGEGSAAP